MGYSIIIYQSNQTNVTLRWRRVSVLDLVYDRIPNIRPNIRPISAEVIRPNIRQTWPNTEYAKNGDFSSFHAIFLAKNDDLKRFHVIFSKIIGFFFSRFLMS